jgi:hypothetical protein
MFSRLAAPCGGEDWDSVHFDRAPDFEEGTHRPFIADFVPLAAGNTGAVLLSSSARPGGQDPFSITAIWHNGSDVMQRAIELGKQIEFVTLLRALAVVVVLG